MTLGTLFGMDALTGKPTEGPKKEMATCYKCGEMYWPVSDDHMERNHPSNRRCRHFGHRIWNVVGQCKAVDDRGVRCIHKIVTTTCSRKNCKLHEEMHLKGSLNGRSTRWGIERHEFRTEEEMKRFHELYAELSQAFYSPLSSAGLMDNGTGRQSYAIAPGAFDHMIEGAALRVLEGHATLDEARDFVRSISRNYTG